jgi:hypothetical protein
LSAHRDLFDKHAVMRNPPGEANRAEAFFHFPPMDSLAEDRGLMPELLDIYHLFGDPALEIRQHR